MNHIYLSGKGYWLHRLFEADEFKGKVFWSMKFYPDPKSWKTFKDSALQQKVKEDDEGKFVTFRRNTKKPWKLKPGESPRFDPPAVTDSDGNKWKEDKLIGNSSAITVKLEVYNSPNGRGARIDCVRVDEWVEYKAPEEYNDDDSSENGESIRPF